MRKAVIEVGEKSCNVCDYKRFCPYDSFIMPMSRHGLRPLKACRDATLAYSVTWGGVRKGKIKGNLKP
jgi:hypothetical protein